MPTIIETNLNRKIELPLGVTSPAFTDKITKNEESIDLTDAEVKFSMRPLLSRHPVIDQEEAKGFAPDGNGDNVAYEWQEEDVVTEGIFMAWWDFTIDEEAKQTPEFEIIFSDHGPGVGTKTGGIVDGEADHMPTTFHALRNDPNFGDRRLQKYATLIQLRIMNSSVEPEEEITAYSLPLLDYFSKRLAFELCTPGIDYWSRQAHTVSSYSPTEIASFPEMIASLEKLRGALCAELENDWKLLRFLVPGLPQRSVAALPASSLEYEDWSDNTGQLVRRNGPIGFITPNPRNTAPMATNYWRGLDPLFVGSYPFP